MARSNSAVARRFRVSRPTVTLWRTRYRERGISGLHNELKPGRPRSTGDEAIAKLINTALKKRPAGKTHWSRRGLAEATGLSTTTTHRYLTLFGVQPHRTGSFKLSTDAFFIEKVRDMACPATPLPSAFHSHLQVLAQSSRAVVCSDHQPGHSARFLQLSGRSETPDQRLRRPLQPTSETVYMDCHRRVNPCQARTTLQSY
jgi:Homeodomain-like domain